METPGNLRRRAVRHRFNTEGRRAGLLDCFSLHQLLTSQNIWQEAHSTRGGAQHRCRVQSDNLQHTSLPRGPAPVAAAVKNTSEQHATNTCQGHFHANDVRCTKVTTGTGFARMA